MGLSTKAPGKFYFVIAKGRSVSGTAKIVSVNIWWDRVSDLAEGRGEVVYEVLIFSCSLFEVYTTSECRARIATSETLSKACDTVRMRDMDALSLCPHRFQGEGELFFSNKDKYVLSLQSTLEPFFCLIACLS
jgi:hypothetical protein